MIIKTTLYLIYEMIEYHDIVQFESSELVLLELD